MNKLFSNGVWKAVWSLVLSLLIKMPSTTDGSLSLYVLTCQNGQQKQIFGVRNYSWKGRGIIIVLRSAFNFYPWNIPLSRNDLNSEDDPFFKAGVWSFIWSMSCGLNILRLRRGLGSCSTTLSRKSCGVMYSWPSNSTDANLIKRLSRAVKRTAFSCGSCSCRWM